MKRQPTSQSHGKTVHGRKPHSLVLERRKKKKKKKKHNKISGIVHPVYKIFISRLRQVQEADFTSSCGRKILNIFGAAGTKFCVGMSGRRGLKKNLHQLVGGAQNLDFA